MPHSIIPRGPRHESIESHVDKGLKHPEADPTGATEGIIAEDGAGIAGDVIMPPYVTGK
jgi:hypothetical protein